MDNVEFAFPGPLRERLLQAIRDGSKTATTSLLQEYRDDPLPRVGDRAMVVDSDGQPQFMIETTQVDIVPLGRVPIRHAVDEGEGHTHIAQRRAAHERFWCSEQMREELGEHFEINDDTPVVLERFMRVEPGAVV